jgi:hypothetical protein
VIAALLALSLIGASDGPQAIYLACEGSTNAVEHIKTSIVLHAASATVNGLEWSLSVDDASYTLRFPADAKFAQPIEIRIDRLSGDYQYSATNTRPQTVGGGKCSRVTRQF